ncbi:ABC transporter ATP-binding protein [Botrimarina mediterranea]|uniref:Multidrug resistance-like ATP-binding protein MdlB n=1 Tax=Botrimarina mediterranea TaxID=2528022 RepID=A0A518K2X4_9BACT|nr:ABC transporter ATP-binding protein [Botrimarina mediterranea]QDV72120.1 Lipid A export ATP-binding/permease protein MsbA [Botrimarina mediterranea]
MKYFLRALGEGTRHWPALVAAIACSLGVAVLWGANIAAMFPLIQTTLSGHSLQETHAMRVEELREKVAAGETKLAALQAADGAADNAMEPASIEAIEARLQLDRAALTSGEWMQARLDAWLPAGPFSTVVLVVSIVFLGTVVRVLLMMANAMLVAHVTQSTIRDLRNRVFNKSLELDRHGFQVMGISGFQAQITHISDMLSMGITSFYGGAITEPLRILSCLIGAFCVSWRLTLVSLIFAPVAAYLVLTLNRRVRSLSSRVLGRSLGFHHVLLEVLGGHHTVQANTMENFERERFDEATGQMKSTAMLANFYNALSGPITEFFGMGMLCVGLLASSYLVLNKQTTLFGIPMTDEPLSIPAVTVFFGLLIGAADPLRKLSGVVTGLNNGMAAATMLYPVLDWESALYEPKEPQPMPDEIQRIELKGVTFSYDRKHDVLRGADVVINRLDRLAVVGPNGAGKSTMVNLICRYYDPQAGEVLIDGKPVKSYRLHDLRSRFAVVSQQTELFNESILHNIRYGRWEATEEEVYEAARLARAHDFINALPDGYNTVIGSNGHRLSGGQRQRVALARAFLRNAEVLILDEATSQIDAQSERLIHDALNDYGADRTILFITHRESTLSLATRVVRVEDGKLVEVNAKAAIAA